MKSLPIIPPSASPVGFDPLPAKRPRTLLLLPPFTQLNTAYPSTTYLTGFLRSHGYPVTQADLGLETALALFSRSGLTRLFNAIRDRPDHAADSRPEVARALAEEARYLSTIDAVIRFLQNRDATLATRICHGDLLPEGPRFFLAKARDDEETDWAFGSLGTSDRARWLASLYLDDLADLARETVAPHFGLSRYGEKLAQAAATFDGLAEALASPPGLIDLLLDEVLDKHLATAEFDLVGLSVPFPGNLYGALRIALRIRQTRPKTRIALGGGYVNTELRDVSDIRLFDLVDYVTLDDGERPILCLLEHLAGARSEKALCRTLLRTGKHVVLSDGASEPDVPQSEAGTPTWDGLPINAYLGVLEVLNPMHRLWSEGRWNKLTVAHGCYWKKCTFCDVGLDYIARYDPVSAGALVDRIDALIAETGESGFHFVDEAAPPLALIDLSLELLARGRSISWWGNIRFEKTFTPDVCRLLAASGCIAVTGGLEVASDRLLALIDKGVTVAQAARVTRAFADANIMVHAYLMYGFPTQTEAETIESLELVRQLFSAGAIHSAFWHRFTLTRHSPIFKDLAAFQVEVPNPALNPFANNDLVHRDPTGCDPDRFSDGLRTAIFNFMQGRGLDGDVRGWFGKRPKKKLPAAPCPPDYVERAIADREADPVRADARLVWLGGPAAKAVEGGKSGLRVTGRNDARFIPMKDTEAGAIGDLLESARPRSGRAQPRLSTVASSWPGGAEAFEEFRRSQAWRGLLEMALIRIP